MMGVNQSAMNIQKATVSATNPVLPPSLMPVADSAGKQPPLQAKHRGQSGVLTIMPDRAHQAAIQLERRQCAAACMCTHTDDATCCEAVSTVQSMREACTGKDYTQSSAGA